MTKKKIISGKYVSDKGINLLEIKKEKLILYEAKCFKDNTFRIFLEKNEEWFVDNLKTFKLNYFNEITNSISQKENFGLKIENSMKLSQYYFFEKLEKFEIVYSSVYFIDKIPYYNLLRKSNDRIKK